MAKGILGRKLGMTQVFDPETGGVTPVTVIEAGPCPVVQVKFADAELLGIPHRLVIAERGLEAGKLEYRGRRDSESREFPRAEALEFIRARLRD